MPNQEKIKTPEWIALKQRAKTMAEAGHTNSQIVAALGCKLATLKDWRRNNFESRSRYLAAAQVERLCVLYANGTPREEIAKEFGRTARSVGHSARRFATAEQKAARDKALSRTPRADKGMHKPQVGSGIVPVHHSILVRTQANASAASQKSQEATTAKPGDPRTWNALWTNGAPWLNGAIPAYPARI